MAYTTIDDPSAYFKVQLYTGDGTGSGSGGQAITFNDTDTTMQPDLIWVKDRGAANSPVLSDSVRGTDGTSYYQIKPSADSAQTTNAEFLLSIQSNGFTVGSNGKWGANTNTYVAWCWKESTTAGLDIIDYDGSGSNTTISHNLSAVPKTIWVKEYSHSTNWAIYHQGAGNTNFLKFNSTAGDEDTDNWQDTTPTSSVFSIGSGGQTNNSGRDYIAYCFAEKQGFSKFGTYVGTGADDGPFVFTGFRPAMVIYKRRGGTEGWMMQDSKRPGFNPIGGNIFPNSTGAESTDARFDFLSNGFKARSGNQNSDETTPYIYMAWAAAPFVNSNGVPSTAF